MDSKAILDYAVFHLTPTRTRCDLVLFRGKLSEKLASGLVEPFVSHLQYAKEQIPKGGYSITLRPPSSDDDDDDDASWFTKATFQRFVRFVSTPEILERIMRLEREILQIESSLQSNEILCIEEAGHQGEGNSPVSDGNGITKKSTNSSKSNTEEEDGSALRENSKVQLQRLMDTRKALLLKEQAMAYARAVVAGYEIETIDDLISFADAFGASRLRAACTDFKDLYKKKHSDDQWMDELAAVQAYPVTDLSYMGTSGIMLAGENFHNNLVRTGSSEPLSDSATSDGSKENNAMSEQNSNGQQQMPWMNQIPPYMYGYQMPPYQGYPMPYFPGHMGFPPPKDHKKHKSSKKKDKSSGEPESDEEDEQITSSDSSSSDIDSAAEKEYDRKHSSKGNRHNKKKKKSSKTVVIRNINYITSQKRSGEEDEISDDESSGAVSLDEASIREGVDNALASLERRNGNNRSHSKIRKNGGKRAENVGDGYDEHGFGDNESNINGGKASDPWGAFQNLLLSHEDSASNVESFDEHLVMKNSNGTFSNGGKNDFHLESQKIKKPLTADDSALVIQRNGVNGFRDGALDFANDESAHPMMKKKIASDGENALFSPQIAESRLDGLDFSSESTRKFPRGEDWYVANNSSGNSQTLNHKQLDFTYDGDFVRKEASKETSVTDDSFIIESTRSAFDDNYASQWKTDITSMFDKTSKTESESPTNSGTGLSRSMDPDELTMVLVRESHESTASWAPEMDYAAEISFTEVDKKTPNVKENDAAVEENGKNSGGKKITKTPVKDMRSKSLSRSRLDSLAKSKTTPASRSTMQKSKSQREEEERKRLEELVIQRQKRIAERTAANNGLSPGASKKLPSKTTPPKLGKSNSMVNGTKSLNQSKLVA